MKFYQDTADLFICVEIVGAVSSVPNLPSPFLPIEILGWTHAFFKLNFKCHSDNFSHSSSVFFFSRHTLTDHLNNLFFFQVASF